MPTDAEPDALREQAPKYSPPPETQRLIDELYKEEVLDARRMSLEEKFLAGEELFQYACTITLWGIRNQYPDLSEDQHRRILEERVALGERLKNL